MKLPKELTKDKYLLNELICKMRFQNTIPLKHNWTCMTYTQISRIVGKSISYCHYVCKDYIKSKVSINSKSIIKSRSKKLEEGRTKIPVNKLNQLHIDFITSEETLKQ